MSDLFITEHGISIHKHGESVILKKDDVEIFEIEIKNIDTVQVFGNIHFSTQVLKEFLERGIEFAIYTWDGKLLGQITPPHLKNIELRYKQYELYKNEAFKLKFARELIQHKIQFSIELVEDSLKNNDLLNLRDELSHLRNWRKKISSVSDIPEIMGVEGSFAKEYFNIFGKLFKQEGIFNGRSKRPPKDIGNAVLSFIYTLVTGRISSYIDGIGFDPYLGYLHSMDYGRVSLSCDMIEPLRPMVCDRLVLKIFNLKMLSESDFENTENGIRLKKGSLVKFLKIYQDEINKEKKYPNGNGKFKDVLIHLTDWLKDCFKTGEVGSLF